MLDILRKGFGMMSFAYWIPFMYAAKESLKWSEIPSWFAFLALFGVGVLFSYLFLRICRKDEADSARAITVEPHTYYWPLRVMVYAMCLGLLCPNVPSLCILGGVFCAVIWHSGAWVMNPFFLLFGIHFYKATLENGFELCLPIQVEKVKEKISVNSENYAICRTGNTYGSYIVFDRK